MRRCRVCLQAVVHLFAEIRQERCHICVAGEHRIFLYTLISFIICRLTLGNITRKRCKQGCWVSVSGKIPQVKQAGGSSIAGKIRVVIGKCKMQNGRLVQFIQVIFRIGKVDQLLHALWQQLVRKPLSAFLTAHNIDSIMAVKMIRQQFVLCRQILSGADLIQSVQIFLSDLILLVGNKIQPAFHAVNAIFLLIAGSIAIQDMPNAVAR